MNKYKKSGWYRESERHALSAKGISTGRKTLGACGYKVVEAKAKFSKTKDRKILTSIENTFKDTEENIMKSLTERKGKAISLTYGMMPVFRDWFSPELDEKYMYELSPDGQEQVNYLFEEMENRLSNNGVLIWGDEGDGSVIWAGDLKAFKKQNPDYELNAKATKKVGKLKQYKSDTVDPYIPPTKENLAFIRKRQKDQESFSKEYLKK